METSKVYFNFSNSAPVKKSNEFDKNVFLQILTAQLKNQDPMNAKDNTEYIAQMAQFSSLEQMQNMNASMERMVSSQVFTEGAMLVGHVTGFKLSDDSYVKDLVKSLRIDNGQVVLITDNGEYTLDQVVGVGDLPSDGQNSGQQNTEQQSNGQQ